MASHKSWQDPGDRECVLANLLHHLLLKERDIGVHSGYINVDLKGPSTVITPCDIFQNSSKIPREGGGGRGGRWGMLQIARCVKKLPSGLQELFCYCKGRGRLFSQKDPIWLFYKQISFGRQNTPCSHPPLSLSV